jgi:hypothetical protein
MYLEKAGSRRMSDWTNLDLQVTQTFPLRPVEIVIGARLGNVFNSQPELSVDQLRYTDPQNTNLNTEFGRPTSYASPRRLTIVGGVSF